MISTAAAQSRQEATAGVDDVTRRLAAWATEVARAAQDGAPPAAVELALLRIRPGMALAGGTASSELELDYRCTVTHDDPLVLQRALGEIAFAAMEGGACGVAAAPDRLGLILTARLTRPRVVPRGPRVQQPLRPRLEPAATLAGRLLGPGQVPLAGVAVQAPDGGGRSVTDPEGRFRLLAGPGAAPSRLVVEIDGVRRVASPAASGPEATFLVAMES